MCFDGEPATCATQSYPRARKAHRCNECRGDIPKGEVYRKVSGVSDGSGFTFKECRRCCHDRQRIRDHEIASGCNWTEAEPNLGGLLVGLAECAMQQTPVEKVPASFIMGA